MVVSEKPVRSRTLRFRMIFRAMIVPRSANRPARE
jgi:hypothetical protein